MDHPATGFPAQMRGLYDCPLVLDNRWLSENSFSAEGYLLAYSPGPQNDSGKITTFQLEARCRDYARSCLVSLYANEADDLHRTGEDRSATSQDPMPRQ